MMRSGMMTVRQALPMIIGVNMAAGVIVLILVVDIKVAILFLLGVAGIVFTNDKARAYRNDQPGPCWESVCCFSALTAR